MLRNKRWEDGWLTVFYGRGEFRNEAKDLQYAFPCKPDGHLLHNAFTLVDIGGGKSLIDELKERGYDIETLQFSVKRKWRPNERPLKV